MSEKRKPIICIDFDGVIHSYENGWQDGVIYGTVVPGFFEWAVAAKDKFTLMVYSSRSKDHMQLVKMQRWLEDRWCDHNPRLTYEEAWASFQHVMTFAHEKPPAFLTIDDRCMQFRGDWTAWWLAPDQLAKFQPWNVTPPPPCEISLMPGQVRLEKNGHAICVVLAVDSSADGFFAHASVRVDSCHYGTVSIRPRTLSVTEILFNYPTVLTMLKKEAT